MIKGAIGMYAGMLVHESAEAVIRHQYRFPRSKSRRIRKKWAKVEDNFRGEPGALVLDVGMGKVLIVHPVVLAHLNRQRPDSPYRAGPSQIVLTSPRYFVYNRGKHGYD